MKQFYIPPEFDVIRDPRRCVNCKICVEQCPNGVHRWDEKHGVLLADESMPQFAVNLGRLLQ